MSRTSAVLDREVTEESVSEKKARSRSVSLKALAVAAVIAALVLGLAVVGWQLHSKSVDLDRLHATAADSAHAEQVALDYATGAADMDFNDLGSWRTRLIAGTSPELTNRLTQAATSMEQIIVPLQWVATATPITAKVSSVDGDTYIVDCFVSVSTTNSQAPNGIQSTATYKLTIDGAHDWVITDIGGIDAALPSTPR